MRAITSLRLALLEQRGHLFCWVPVCLGIGIGLYFLMRSEPAHVVLFGLAGLAVAMAVMTRWVEADTGAILWALVLIAAGFSLAAARTKGVAGPVLDWRYYGPVEGRVVGIDRSGSDALRLTLADVVLADMAPAQTPQRVRVSLHGDWAFVTPEPGMIVALTAHLAPPSGPVEPGGFDFQRHAFFKRLGAVGYARTPALEFAPAAAGFSIFGFRMRLSQAIQLRMPQDVQGFAAAVTTGDRSGIPKATILALRSSNLAHLLAISGLHMGLLAGFVFALVRVGLACVPAIALRINTKKVAAGTALIASVCYLLLSGGNVSTERAFVMTSVMLTAVLLERRALSLRAVAVAAIVVLVMRPEALLGPGFQMSFAATTALVAVFGWLRDTDIGLGPRWLRPVSTVFVSSLVAGLATAPFGALHFNQVAQYGLLANLLSVPVMGSVVVPSAVLAGVLSPFGLEQVGLWGMGQGLRWILTVADWVSGLDGARSVVPSANIWVLPMLSLGGLWLVLWRGRARWAGAGVVVVALLIWSQTERPDILIADTGGLVGVMTDQGRALSKPKGQGFVAKNWLENDGSSMDQVAAASLWQQGQKSLRIVDLNGAGRLIHVQGKRGAALFDGCDPSDFVVFSNKYEGALPCTKFDPGILSELGAVAIRLKGADRQVISARQVTGQRPWNSKSR